MAHVATFIDTTVSTTHQKHQSSLHNISGYHFKQKSKTPGLYTFNLNIKNTSTNKEVLHQSVKPAQKIDLSSSLQESTPPAVFHTRPSQQKDCRQTQEGCLRLAQWTPLGTSSTTPKSMKYAKVLRTCSWHALFSEHLRVAQHHETYAAAGMTSVWMGGVLVLDVLGCTPTKSVPTMLERLVAFQGSLCLHA